MFDSDSSSQSDSYSPEAQVAYSEEIILALENPKKRAGRKKLRKTRHPVYRGGEAEELWEVGLRGSGAQQEVQDMARKVPYCKVGRTGTRMELRGRRAAFLNFAGSAWPVPASEDSRDIQKAAADAAERFSPEEGDHGVREEDESVEDECWKVAGEENKVFYMDNEDALGKPGLLANIAEATILPPPHYGLDSYAQLWNFAI